MKRLFEIPECRIEKSILQIQFKPIYQSILNFKSVCLVSVLAIVSMAQSQNTTNYSGQLDVLNYLNITEENQKVIDEIIGLEKEINLSNCDIAALKLQIDELSKIKNLSSEYDGVKVKAEKKIEKNHEIISFMKSDIEEYKSVCNKLLYNLYSTEIEKEFKHKKIYSDIDINNYRNQAENLKTRAIYIDLIQESELPNQQIFDSLVQMNRYFELAIENQRAALALCYKIEIPCMASAKVINDKPTTKIVPLDYSTLAVANEEEVIVEDFDFLHAENTETVLSVTESTPTVAIIDSLECSKDELKVSLIDIQKICNITIDSMLMNKTQSLVFKIQIGAFVNKVDEKEFKGLSPLVVEQSLNGYDKVMVGVFKSYKAALQTCEVIKKTGDYKDAFVVAYYQKQRISIKQALELMDDTSEKDAYISFKSTGKIQ